MEKPEIARIGLVGYYQHLNYGDDLLALLFYKKLIGYPHTEVVVFDADRAVLKAIGVANTSSWEDSFRSCSKVIFGGGGILGELAHGKFSWRIFIDYCRKVFALKRAGIPYAMVAVGAGPVRTLFGRLLIRYMVSGAEYVCVRDDRSFELLRYLMPEKRLFKGADYALSLGSMQLPTYADVQVDEFLAELPRPILGVNLMTMNGHEGRVAEADLHAAVKADILQAYDTGKVRSLVILLNSASYDEMRDAVDFLDRLPVAIFKVFVHRDVWETTRLIARLDALFTMKLHFSIVAYVLRVPVACVGYHPKTRRFFEEIERLAYHEESNTYRKGSPLIGRFLDDFRDYYSTTPEMPIHADERVRMMNAMMEKFVGSVASNNPTRIPTISNQTGDRVGCGPKMNRR